MVDRLVDRINWLRVYKKNPDVARATLVLTHNEQVVRKRNSFLSCQIESGGGLITQLGLTGRLRDLTEAVIDGFYLSMARHGHAPNYPSSEYDNELMDCEQEAIKLNGEKVVDIVEEMGEVLGSVDRAWEVKGAISTGLQRPVAIFGDGFDARTKRRFALNHALGELIHKLSENEDFQMLKYHYLEAQPEQI